jgi:hypothetical protein
LIDTRMIGSRFPGVGALICLSLVTAACTSSDATLPNTSLPPLTAPPTPSVSPLTLAAFVQRVQRSLDESAALRPRASAAVEQAKTFERSLLNKAHATFVRILFTHQVERANLATWNAPREARQAATLLDAALGALIEDDRAYINWIGRVMLPRRKGEAKVSLAKAQQDDVAVAQAEALFLARFNPLRSRVGLRPLPSDYAF